MDEGVNNFLSLKNHPGLVGRVFANGSGDLGSIPGRVILKTLKMVLDTSLLNTQQYKVRIKGKVEQSRERNSALMVKWDGLRPENLFFTRGPRSLSVLYISVWNE